ncbi:hypothetical protein L861_11595 [Litchfieldella anticariensis FP35 = DSM 16096]|uniref:SGNH hydrolase-type esterase domain-containing protein n=1 Tax=Litchfieldella anticariensis (strain DSM 16096 / CECT 5854 / CIP 108499 / LMG 22089 / FP35) TaxID=1121939 RepID=S2L8Y6_LITA3|nr:arylesterase [Halomonas anticariensis]EPC01211.1 hypothetical protein L861_11595 [Halomonas anticariensis FP35 = DSM 16096]
MVKEFPVFLRIPRSPQRVAARLWLACLVWLCLVAAPVHADTRPTLLVMGDSLSAAYGIEQEQSWVHLLAERLGDDIRVINASISGETTSGGLSRLPELLRQHEPELVLLELGGNDGLRGLSPRQMHANLAKMIEASHEADAGVLLLGIDIPPNYGPAYREAFRNTYTELAETYNVPLVPFILENIALDESLMQGDGIHPTASAQPIILDNVWPKLETLLERHVDLSFNTQD